MRPEDDGFLPTLTDPHTRHLRQLFLLVVTGGCLVMIPWIVYLAGALPTRHPAEQWRVAWVGFDILLVGALLATAIAAWLKRQIVIVSAVVTATLLVCDAWFDVSLDWGTADGTASILSAVFCELPLAGYLMGSALRLIRLTFRSAFRITGHDGPTPPLRKLSVLAVRELAVRELAVREPGERDRAGRVDEH
jgi:hypothetical protein